MNDKIKSKLVDTLATFIGSFIGLYLFNNVSPSLFNLLNYLGWKQETIGKAQGFVWAFSIAIGFILVLILFEIIIWLFGTFSLPKITVTFLNQKNKEIDELDFSDEIKEPHYLKICFKARFNEMQLFIIKNVLKAKIKVYTNPKMCSFELAEGFIANNNDFYNKGNLIYFDLFSKFSPSKEYSEINVELNLLLIHSARGTVNIELDLSELSPFFKFIFKKYCKFKIGRFTISG